jgi:NAD-dependent deacetylase
MGELEVVAGWIRDARRVVYLCGAGLSVPSGIRAYRTGPEAIWDTYVLEWGTRERFMADPAAWWQSFWLRAHGEVLKSEIRPNPGHRALVALAGRRDSDLVITQNIDGLHRAAGHPEPALIEIHGRHDRFICAAQRGCPGIDEPVASVDLSRVGEGVYPRCPRCGAPMRPLVLLFDEYYEAHRAYQADRARRALETADVVVFVGTSFSVGITAAALRAAQLSQARIANVNVEPAPFGGVLHVGGGAEVVLPELARRALPRSPA